MARRYEVLSNVSQSLQRRNFQRDQGVRGWERATRLKSDKIRRDASLAAESGRLRMLIWVASSFWWVWVWARSAAISLSSLSMESGMRAFSNGVMQRT